MQSARKLSEAGKALLDAKHFKELLSVRFSHVLSELKADMCPVVDPLDR